ncbi:MAG TPA: NADH-quinone oxidoreductase subunit J [Anaeromyxobacteraceae bacterium]|nr:NADH-quinone oxidoreductase subunit J [Anaeromyxobacteraceae bacterium]
MSDKAELVLFWVFAVPALLSAAGVLAARNPVHAAMSLVSTFFFLAGIYVLLTAHLIAFLQVIVYAGAIMVLFLFVIMLLSLSDEELGVDRMTAMKWAGALGGAGLFATLVWVYWYQGGGSARVVGPDYGTVKAVGRLLFTQYLLPFEATSVLLLVAIVGAVVVSKRRI